MGQGFLTGNYNTDTILVNPTVTVSEDPALTGIVEKFETEKLLKENNYPLCRFRLDGCTEEEIASYEEESTVSTPTTSWFLTKNNNEETTTTEEPTETTTTSNSGSDCIVLFKVESGIRVVDGKVKTLREPHGGTCVNNEIQLQHPIDPRIWEPVNGIKFEGNVADLYTDEYNGWKATVTYSYISCTDYLNAEVTPPVTNPGDPTIPDNTEVKDTFEYIYKNIRSRPCQTDMSDKNYLIHTYALEDNKRIIITVDMRTRYKIITTISGDNGYPYNLVKTTLHDENTFINTDYSIE